MSSWWGDLTSFAKEESVCLFVLIENVDQKDPFPKNVL